MSLPTGRVLAGIVNVAALAERGVGPDVKDPLERVRVPLGAATPAGPDKLTVTVNGWFTTTVGA